MVAILYGYRVVKVNWGQKIMPVSAKHAIACKKMLPVKNIEGTFIDYELLSAMFSVW